MFATFAVFTQKTFLRGHAAVRAFCSFFQIIFIANMPIVVGEYVSGRKPTSPYAAVVLGFRWI